MVFLSIEENEKILFKMINEHKEKYFNLMAIDKDFEEKIYESYDSLVNIKNFLENRFKIRSRGLLSKLYIE